MSNNGAAGRRHVPQRQRKQGSGFVSSMTFARRHSVLLFFFMHRLHVCSANMLGSRRPELQQRLGGVVRVEFKRNLGMQAEMKRDSSGSMGHWGASGTRYFGAGFRSTCRSAARRSWSDNASVSRGDGLRTDDLRTTGPGPRLGLCGRSRVVSSVRAACRHAQLEGGREGRGDGSAVLLVMSACMYGSQQRPPARPRATPGRPVAARPGWVERNMANRDTATATLAAAAAARCGVLGVRGRGGAEACVVWCALWCGLCGRVIGRAPGRGGGGPLALSPSLQVRIAHRRRSSTQIRLTPRGPAAAAAAARLLLCLPACLPASSVATVRNLLLRRTGKRLVCCAVCCLFRAARSSPGPAAAAVLWSKRIHACLLPLPVPTHTLARSTSLAIHAASQPRSLPSQLLSPNWPSPHATDRQSAR